MTKAILWDMDGTLIDSEPAHHAALDNIAAEIGIIVPEEFHLSLTGTTLENVHSRFQKLANTNMEFEVWKAKKWYYYEQHAQEVIRREPLASLATELAKRKVPMAVVSNSTKEEVECCMQVTKLDEVIPNYICRYDVTHGKPEPDSYLLGAKHLKVEPKDCLVVEDSLPGAQAGINAKMQVLYHPQHEVQDESLIPKGADFIPYNQSPVDYIENFLKG
ncbi:MAG: HAD family hydrolase [Alphaproteobacteria bacterium]